MVKLSRCYLLNLKTICVTVLLTTFLFSNGYAQKKKHHSPDTSVDSSTSKKNIVKYGTASFYAKKFEGRKTASGEIYNSTKYTAACNVLPLKTWIKVTNLRNNNTVIVKINDRLNPKNKRLVDLSKIAAQKLGYVSRGLTRVKIEVLKNFKVGM